MSGMCGATPSTVGVSWACTENPYLLPSPSSHLSTTNRNLNNSRFNRSKKHIPRASSYSQIPISLSSTTLPHPQQFPVERLAVLADLDPATANLAIAFLGPFLSGFGFLFIARIVMSWYPKLPVDKFPYVIAYAPTEPLLLQTRKLIPPLAGVDVTPVVWFALLSFLNEILIGPQGLLVLVSRQI